ncbi:hypothetical protein [Natrinema sp. SYSU A 869]|uniref:hypothetical protein n=1 Tax=Natrinema sp. SYSU A 869 TaxID=2871694 RepID=UPI001CA43B13|nr:hypothetical protein [Natrinema sp. SYSU A 869]
MKRLVCDRSNSWVTERCRQCGQQRTSSRFLPREPPDDMAFTTVASETESRETASQSIATRPKAAVSDGDETART